MSASSPRLAWLWPTLMLAALVVVWEGAVRVSDTPLWMLPPPSAIAESFGNDWRMLLQHTRVTLVEVLLGFGLALVAGIATGVLIDSSSILRRTIYPLIIASQTIPMVALAPLLLIWFGYGLTPKILITALIGFFPIAVNTVDGLRSADREILSLLRAMGSSGWQRFRMVRVPSALPLVFSGARIAITFCVIGAIFGELVGASEGLGYLMTRSAAQFQTARLFACIVILALMGIGLFGLVAVVERRVLPWRRYVTVPGG
ncbi:MAG TPA: ABC transporter permease [Thermomicrobiales bacterium]|nr:ABC transporter permease [Thermomicrobiales bacterium]